MDKTNISSDLIRGHLDTIILNSLIENDKYAQQINDYVKEKTGGKYEINQASLYSSLKRLESLKYIEGFWHDSETGRRRFFKISEQGKSFVEKNIENWNDSKKIIDILVTSKNTDENSENINVKQTNTTETADKNNLNDLSTISPEISGDNKPNINNIQETSVKNDAKSDTDKVFMEKVNDNAINYRSILNDLITNNNSEETNTKPEQEYLIDNLNFDAIKDININTNEFFDNTYKYRFSNSKYKKPNGSLFINKIRFFSAISTFLLVMIEVLIATIFYNNYGKDYKFIPFIYLGVAFVPLCLFIINYVLKPQHTTKTVNKDSIFISIIICINLILLTFVINLLANTDFYNTSDLVIKFLSPSLFYLNIIVYTAFQYLFSKNNNFILKQSK